MCSNMTMSHDVPPAAPEDISHNGFQISYIYLSTIGLIITIGCSNGLSLIFNPPAEQYRKKSLYSRLIWDSPFFEKFWSESDEEKQPIVKMLKTENPIWDKSTFFFKLNYDTAKHFQYL